MKIGITPGLGGWIRKSMNRYRIHCKIIVCLFVIRGKSKVTRKSQSSSNIHEPRYLSQNNSEHPAVISGELSSSFPINSAHGSYI